MALKIHYSPNELKLIGETFPKGSSSALNKMAQQARTKASSLIRERYNIQKQDLDKNFSIKRASPNQLQASLMMATRRLTVARFLARTPKSQKGIPVAERQPIEVRITKGTKKIIRGAFYVAKLSQVFHRVGNKLQIVHTISPSEMFGARTIQQQLNAFIEEKLPQLLKENIGFFGR